jgi:single-strand DNA-binding protein
MASRSVNKVILIGNLGRDAETRFTANGTARTTFPVATSRRWKDQQTGEWREETDWHNVVLWRQENVAGYLTKGRQVYVEGRLQTRSYEDKKDGRKIYITEIVADDVILLGGRGADAGVPEEFAQAAPSRAGHGPQTPVEEPPAEFGITDDDVPF